VTDDVVTAQPVARDAVTGTSSPAYLLRTNKLNKYFNLRTAPFRPKVRVHAVDSVSLSIAKQETLGLVGESGSGKTTLGWTIVRLHRPTAGTIEFEGKDISQLTGRSLNEVHRRLQMIFQNPWTSLDPQQTVGTSISEPLDIHKVGGSRRERDNRVAELLTLVGLRRADAERYPHEMSGGQRQRVGIARALALNPTLLVADEPTSSLDVSVQAQIVNLLQDLQEQLGLTYLFITHNLHLVRRVSHRIAVMYLGRVVEVGTSSDVFDHPLHPYTAALVASKSAGYETKRIVLRGEIPSPLNPPSGCYFRTRCPIAKPQCAEQYPPLTEVAPGREVACFFPGEVAP
jgi:oligopeptide/dipeptide ABC transporter ATP-binding protein